MRRYVVFALAAPVVLWAGLVLIGGKRGDNAGMLLVRPGPIPLPSGVALTAMGAGLLAAYLTK